MKQFLNINGEKKKQLMNINGEKNVQREIFGSHGFQQKTQSFVAQTGEICEILFLKNSTVFCVPQG